MFGAEIERLVQLLSRLPGLGPRSGRRAALALLKRKETLLLPLLEQLGRVAEKVRACRLCGNLDSEETCAICRDPRRDARALCVVEDVADLWAIERSGAFRGRYHVLGGTLSALDGVGPDELSVGALVARVKAGGIDEVILALNATVEGQTTAHYLSERLQGLGVGVTRLAHGVPIGGELDYLDDGTLATALKARRPAAD
jgi:recombination protein RecR